MIKNKLKLVCPSLGLLFLTGCASIVNGTHENVQVVTTPVSEVSCLLSNDEGKWHIDSTPGTVTVHRAYSPLAITCRKKGYAASNRTVQSRTKAMAFGNILFGGFIGGGVDAADGAAYDYPETITIAMKKRSKQY